MKIDSFFHDSHNVQSFQALLESIQSDKQLVHALFAPLSKSTSYDLFNYLII